MFHQVLVIVNVHRASRKQQVQFQIKTICWWQITPLCVFQLYQPRNFKVVWCSSFKIISLALHHLFLATPHCMASAIHSLPYNFQNLALNQGQIYPTPALNGILSEHQFLPNSSNSLLPTIATSPFVTTSADSSLLTSCYSQIDTSWPPNNLSTWMPSYQAPVSNNLFLSKWKVKQSLLPGLAVTRHSDNSITNWNLGFREHDFVYFDVTIIQI